jgi:hypothetical protein
MNRKDGVKCAKESDEWDSAHVESCEETKKGKT